MDMTKARFAMAVCLAASILCFLIAKTTDSIVFYILGFVALAGEIVFSFFNRCPHCGHSLNRHHMYNAYCPYCGQYL